jgi:NADH:ubiquinone oxidoreductase subunit F (NADH-binding)
MTELCATMADASICGLGQTAGNPILSMMKHFKEDFA